VVLIVSLIAAKMVSSKRVLIVCTSHEQLGDSKEKTGLWMEELVAPYNAFKAQGYDVTVSSISGGEIPVDEASLGPPYATKDVEEFILSDVHMKELLESVPLAEIDASEYDAIFLPGGHGTCWDFPDDEQLQKDLEKAAAAGKVIGAVCHGLMALVNVKDSDGVPIVKGKKVTGFSNDEEYAVAKETLVPFLVEDKLKELGGEYCKAEANWGVCAVRDGNLITGQNPSSSQKTAELVIEALEQQ